MNRPLFLLLGTGAALGLNFPIGKMAMAAGVTPALWAAVISAGAGLDQRGQSGGEVAVVVGDQDAHADDCRESVGSRIKTSLR